jgi:hypothetical protein
MTITEAVPTTAITTTLNVIQAQAAMRERQTVEFRRVFGGGAA